MNTVRLETNCFQSKVFVSSGISFKRSFFVKSTSPHLLNQLNALDGNHKVQTVFTKFLNRRVLRSFSTAQELPLSFIRNMGIIAHVDAGKTTTAECMLYYAGKVNRIGEVDKGDTVLDYLKMERERGITITSAAISLNWKGTTINLIDTPGHVDFTVEVERSVRVLDGAVAIFDAVHGVQPQSETVWKQANRYGVPRIAFLNKMDREGASIEDCVKMMEKRLGAVPLVIQMPMGDSANFNRIIDLITLEVLSWSGKLGEIVTKAQLKGEYLEKAKKARASLLEKVAFLDDEIMDLMLKESRVDALALKKALKRLTIEHKAVPVLCGASLKRIGVQPILDAILDFLPSPIERPPVLAKSVKDEKPVLLTPNTKDQLCALAFKVIWDQHRGLVVYFRVYSGIMHSGETLLNATQNTKERTLRLFRVEGETLEDLGDLRAGDIGAAIGLKTTRTGDTIVSHSEKPLLLPGITAPPPVFFCSIEPSKQSEEKNLNEALRLLQMEDPSFHLSTDPDTGQLLVSGMGELHLDIIRDRIQNHYNVDATMGKISISYRGTLSEKRRETYATQLDLSGKKQSASLTILLEPIERGSGHLFAVTATPPPIKTTNLIWDEVIWTVKEGVQAGYDRGILGYPAVDVRATLMNVEIQNDSSLAAFRKCASLLVNKVFNTSPPRLLEPIMDVHLSTDELYLGMVLSDLTNTRRGKIKEVNDDGVNAASKIIVAEVPLKELVGYATSLRSITKGSGTFSMEFKYYGDMSSQEEEIVLKQIRGL